jgi:hypothetical protein
VLFNNVNYTDYTVTKTGGGASGTWGINITGTAGSETLATVMSRGSSSATYISLTAGGMLSGGQYMFRNAAGSGVYLGANTTTATTLQAYSEDGGPAFMSFHRAGSYAVNMGLDPDNVFRLGGWSAGADRLVLDMSGNLSVPGLMSNAQSYTGGWFRNNTANTGVYNENTTMHFSSKDNGYWDVSSTTTVSSIRFFTGGHVYAGTLRGYLYANSSNEIGFLDSAGSWLLRCVGGTNASFFSGSVTGTAFFESSDIRLKNVLAVNPDINVDVDVIKFERKDTSGVRYGYSAQQVQDIMPELVAGDDFLSVNYLDLHTLKIAALEKEIRELKAKLGN